MNPRRLWFVLLVWFVFVLAWCAYSDGAYVLLYALIGAGVMCSIANIERGGKS